MKPKYRVVIVGSGHSAIFWACTLVENENEDITILERGKDIHEHRRGRAMELLCG